MTRTGFSLARRDRVPGGSRLPAQAAGHDTEPHARATTSRAAAAEPASRETKVPNAAPIRLLDTQARGHIGRRLLYQQPSGELTEDVTWRWSSAPDRYLDTALRHALASNPGLRLVDAASAAALATNLLAWHLESRRHDTTRRRRRVRVDGE